MMNRKIITFMFILMITFTFVSGFTVFAKSNNVNDLKNKLDKTSEDDVNAAINEIYLNDIVPGIIAHHEDLITSDISDQAIKDATLSSAMPVFSSKEKYKKGEDFKSKLQFSGWMVVAYSDSKPIVVFSIKKQNGMYNVTNLLNEHFAEAFAESLIQLNSNTPIVIPASGYFFLGDTNDNISLAKPRNKQNTKYDLKTFDQLNTAVNKSIDYYSDQTEPATGGSILLEYLYGNNTVNSKSYTSYFVIIAIGLACLLSAYIFFRNRKIKSKIN